MNVQNVVSGSFHMIFGRTVIGDQNKNVFGRTTDQFVSFYPNVKLAAAGHTELHL